MFRIDEMLIYHKSGITDYSTIPVPVHNRIGWEFSACVNGVMAPTVDNIDIKPIFRKKTLYIFPKELAHGWIGKKNKNVERIVFHFTVVPDELIKAIPERGFFSISLSDDDCVRLQVLADRTTKSISHPTEITALETHTLVSELSLIALRKGNPRSLEQQKSSYIKVEQAISWYLENISSNPSLVDISQSVFVSPSHLRRIFHSIKNESPQMILNKLRMDYAKNFIIKSNISLELIAQKVGFSTASVLSRAIRTHFGCAPSQFRKHK